MDSLRSPAAIHTDDKAAVTVREVAAIRRHCGVFTRREIAEAMLDAVGWREDRPLERSRLLEPACGDGAFVVPAVDRLLRRLKALGLVGEHTLADRIVAFEFDASTAAVARERIATLLRRHGLGDGTARMVASTWIRTADFILAGPDGPFTHIVGNPPYMRWSRIGDALRRAYEKVLPAFAARGDLCVPFLWRAVELLGQDGRAALLCSDRWLRCRYGTDLREAIVGRARLAAHVEAHDTPLFEGSRRVRAYPAISILVRGNDAPEQFERCDGIDKVVAAVRGIGIRLDGKDAAAAAPAFRWYAAGAFAERDVAACADALMEGGVPLEQAGLHVRCGMALGCAEAFLLDDPADVEPERALPFAVSKDIDGRDEIEHSRWIADVWDEAGALIDPDAFPRLRARLERFRGRLARRACVLKRAAREWFRTIDRKDVTTIARPRLAVAGMSRRARIGILPPGVALANSAYTIHGDGWPLRELLWLLRQGPIDVIASAYAPRFGGSTLRFDGTVLRRVPVPRYRTLPHELKTALKCAAQAGCSSDAWDVLAALYGMRDAKALDGLRRVLERAAN